MDLTGVTLDVLALLVRAFTGVVTFMVLPTVLYVLSVVADGESSFFSGRVFGYSMAYKPIREGGLLKNTQPGLQIMQWNSCKVS